MSGYTRPDTRYPDIEVELTGADGNIFEVIGRVVVAMSLSSRKISGRTVDEFALHVAGAGSYPEALQRVMTWVTVT